MTGLRALGISLLRTFVSWIWALFMGWLLLVLPIFDPFKEQLLALPDLALPTLIGVIAAAWYALWRWLEPRLPDWLTAALLGSAKTPTYIPSVSANRIAVNPTSPSSAEAARVASQSLDRVDGPDHRA